MNRIPVTNEFSPLNRNPAPLEEGKPIRDRYITRREFAGAALATVGAATAGSLADGADQPLPMLPTVRWGEHDITRVLVGHNPIKGMSHQTGELSREMKLWFADEPRRAVQLLRRCRQVGINACQIGFRRTEGIIKQTLRTHYAQGGRMKWIATFYSRPHDRAAVKEELAQLLAMDPPPIGVQQLGNTSDWLMRQGQLELAKENLKRFRDAGLLVGLGSHNHEVIDYAENNNWDVDFYQCCFYRSAFSLDRAKTGREMFEEEARESMTHTIRQVSKPCLAFKVLGAGRHCASPRTVAAALRYAFEHIKPTDVILLGMWNKYQDQVAQNAAYARKILARS